MPFSPIEDQALPENIDGLYLGGGYPELYANRLAENQIMRQSVKTAIASGLPTVAECGGFLYLLEALDGAPMAGVLPTAARMMRKLQPFGYVTLTARKDNLLCGAVKPNGRAWDGGFASDTLYAGFPHLYFRAKPEIAANFVRKCAAWRNRK